MRVLLRISELEHCCLLRHLLPKEAVREEAAFLFGNVAESENVVIDIKAIELLESEDLAAHQGEYLELRDETQARLIKRAHDLDACLIEVHSHPFPFPAVFSDADIRGLGETVPAIQWRLKKKPYIAIVVAPDSFDAFVWMAGGKSPRYLDAIIAGDRVLTPTNLSRWSSPYVSP